LLVLDPLRRVWVRSPLGLLERRGRICCLIILLVLIIDVVLWMTQEPTFKVHETADGEVEDSLGEGQVGLHRIHKECLEAVQYPVEERVVGAQSVRSHIAWGAWEAVRDCG